MKTFKKRGLKLLLTLFMLLSLLLIFKSVSAQTPSLSTDSLSNSTCSKLDLGDADCSGKITLLDFEIWRTEYNHERLTFEADFDGDRIVGKKDYNIWAKNFTAENNNE